ncbi:conserved hypothetical protein [Verticillium alfalfae VaMs.102]|uniref:Uncharacterized protein n=1 Tax=Verticillium alfalfae (strain VaMs.102 / ATCC MYA-4576 / FGSC 10136) TaxID=526221 RepID=C9SWS0_VERA1|nr:conserved hypothetical protein [Verticillium alfalfae VaMs.102]EEY23461.1 conserved hypothetical protein [Verticillium alfalfae VaMs.102]
MHRSSTLRLLVCLLAGSAAAQRKGGGGGGGGGGSSNDDDDSSTGGGGGDSGGDDSGSGSGSGTDDGSSRPDNSAPCGYFARLETFGLPGLYYNGTLTVRHHITHNTVWDEESEPIDVCDNDDRDVKTSRYPALVLIAPTGNESDTNPMHWVLRGFQPAHEYHALRDAVDFKQRWVYIRSSDFVISNYTREYNTVFSPYWTNRYDDSDATDLEETTRVYWPTNITAEDDGTFSAQAEYAQAPPIINSKDYIGSFPRPGKHTSQYVTVKSVCSMNQRYYEDEEDIDTVRGSDGAKRRRQDDDGFDENGERIWYSSNPTFWLDKGATMEMAGIGADQMTLTLNNSLDKAIPWMGEREGGCSPDEREPFELSNFNPMQSAAYEGQGLRPWNVTLRISLSFEGSIVRENSTTVNGVEGGKLLFNAGYKLDEAIEEEEEEDNKSIAAQAMFKGYAVLIVVMVAGFVAF